MFKGKLPELLTPEQTYNLWLQPFTKEIVDQLIEGNMRIATAIAARYAQRVPWTRNDIFSESLLGLTIAINNLKKCEFVDGHAIRGYVRKTIHGAIAEYITVNMNFFTISSKQISRIRQGKDTKFKALENLPSIDDEDNRDAINNLVEEKQRVHLIDRMEMLMRDAGLSDVEYRVLFYYLANCTEEEIAAALNLTRKQVHRIKHEAAEKIRYIFFEDC